MKYEKHQIKLLIIKLLTQSFKVYENLECDANLSNNLFLIFISLFLHFCLSFLPLYTHTHTQRTGVGRTVVEETESYSITSRVPFSQQVCYWLFITSFEKTLMLRKIEGRRSREKQRMRWLDGITDFSGHEFEQTLEDDEGQGSLACCIPWVAKSWTWFSDWTTTLCLPLWIRVLGIMDAVFTFLDLKVYWGGILAM